MLATNTQARLLQLAVAIDSVTPLFADNTWPLSGPHVLVHAYRFNGNVDGEMVLNGTVWPRYQVGLLKDAFRGNRYMAGLVRRYSPW